MDRFIQEDLKVLGVKPTTGLPSTTNPPPTTTPPYVDVDDDDDEDYEDEDEDFSDDEEEEEEDEDEEESYDESEEEEEEEKKDDIWADYPKTKDVYDQYLHKSKAQYSNEHEYFIKAKNDLQKRHHEKVTKVNLYPLQRLINNT